MKTKIFILSLILFFFSTSIHSQYLINPSFEGNTGFAQIPNGWEVCDPYSTPDTQPGVNGVYSSASHGNTFLTLVSRGAPAPSAGRVEDCRTLLYKPLRKDKCYTFKIDVKISPEYYFDDFGDIYQFDQPLLLNIYGNHDYCTIADTFYLSDTITNTEWKTIEFTIIPKVDSIHYIYIHPDFTHLPAYFGNIQLDNMQLFDRFIPDYVAIDTLINYGESITLQASNGLAYSWNPSDDLSCNDCQTPTTTPNLSTTYTVDIQANSQCDNHKEMFTIGILPFIPNIITPNGDGINDKFRILGLSPNSYLLITNRMGDVLFETDNYENNWDGLYKGALLPPDTYWYTFKSKDLTESQVGFIYLKQTY